MNHASHPDWESKKERIFISIKKQENIFLIIASVKIIYLNYFFFFFLGGEGVILLTVIVKLCLDKLKLLVVSLDLGF